MRNPDNWKNWKARKIAELGEEGYKQFERDRAQRRRYGITQRELGDCCAVCGSTDRLHVDHNHTTGKVRGVLCFNCNGALGHVRDSREILAGLIKYLDRSL